MNKHTLMKMASAVIAASMLAGTGLPVYADTASLKAASAQTQKKEEAMKSALTKVKKRVTIPEKLSEFSYSTDRDFSTDCYHFTWKTPDGGKVGEQININIVENIITSYNYFKSYTEKEDDPDFDRKQSFAKLSDEEMLAKAKAYMKMLNPDIYTQAEYEVRNISLFGNTASIGFRRKKNGVYVDGNGGTIVIDKDTGELYSCTLTWFEAETDFASAASRLKKAEAIESFKKLCTLNPAYAISTDWETGEKEAHLVYRPSFTEEMDAFTGKASSIWEDMSKDGGSKSAPWSWTSGGYYYDADAGYAAEDDVAMDEMETVVTGEGGVNAVSFTDAELREIDAAKGLLTNEEIKSMLQKDKYVQLPGWVPLNNAKLYKNSESGEYFYNMSFSTENAEPVKYVENDGSTSEEVLPYYYLSVYLNAKTGKILNFNKYTDNSPDSTKKYPVSANNKIAEAAVKYFYPDIYSEYKADKNNTAPAEYYTDIYADEVYDEIYAEGAPAANSTASSGKSGKQTKHYETVRNFVFNRHVNGVIVEGDSINVSIDNTGAVLSVNYRHTDITFPAVPRFDNSKAFSSLFKQQELELYYDGYYKKDGTIKTYLIYKTDSFTLDSKYRIVRYDGTPSEKAADDNTDYVDIKGTKYEKAITTLARYGITLPTENGEFKPNSTLTDKEFAIIVYGVLNSYVPYYISNGGYKEDEKAVVLTNAEAAKVFVTASGGSSYAELEGIYKSPYTDVPASNKYVGYISIAKAKGYMTGSGGKFNPGKKLSRGQAMQIVYDYVENLNKTSK